MEKYLELKGYKDQDGKFKQLPGKKQKKKLDLMIEYLSEQFERERKYSEGEVNEILNAHHSFNDSATLRRLLFGNKILDRTLDGREYWKLD